MLTKLKCLSNPTGYQCHSSMSYSMPKPAESWTLLQPAGDIPADDIGITVAVLSESQTCHTLKTYRFTTVLTCHTLKAYRFTTVLTCHTLKACRFTTVLTCHTLQACRFTTVLTCQTLKAYRFTTVLTCLTPVTYTLLTLPTNREV